MCQGQALEISSLMSTHHPRLSEWEARGEWPPCSLVSQLASWGRREGSISSPLLSHIFYLESTHVEALR